jgi:hypothetical protein
MAVGHRQDLHKAGWTQSDNYLTAEKARVLAGWIGCQGLCGDRRIEYNWPMNTPADILANAERLISWSNQ